MEGENVEGEDMAPWMFEEMGMNDASWLLEDGMEERLERLFGSGAEGGAEGGVEGGAELAEGEVGVAEGGAEEEEEGEHDSEEKTVDDVGDTDDVDDAE